MKIKKIIIGVVILGCIVVLPDAGKYYRQLAVKFQRVPEVYRTCRTLDSLKDDDYDVLEIQAQYFEPILQINDSTLLIAGRRDKENNGKITIEDFWYKLDQNGYVVDSLTYIYPNTIPHNYKTVDRYIIDTESDSYNTWIAKGDTTNYLINNLDQDRRFSKREIEKLLSTKEYVAKEYVTEEIQVSPSDSEKGAYKLFLYGQGQWNYLLTDSYDDPQSRDSKLEITYAGELTDEDDGLDFIRREYIHKDNWIQYSFWDFGRYLRWGTGNHSHIDHWEGTSYFKIVMPHKTLYFKQPNKIYEQLETRELNNYKVYRSNDKKYLLLRGIDQGTCYVIRPKS